MAYPRRTAIGTADGSLQRQAGRPLKGSQTPRVGFTRRLSADRFFVDPPAWGPSYSLNIDFRGVRGRVSA
jgi:hypothetical protein